MCKHVVTPTTASQIANLLRDVEQYVTRADTALHDNQRPIDVSESILSACRRYLPPEHYLYRRVTQHHYTQALQQQHWSEAYHLAAYLLAAYRSLLLDPHGQPPVNWHPVVTVRLYAVAKLADLCANNATLSTDTTPDAHSALELVRAAWNASAHTHDIPACAVAPHAPVGALAAWHAQLSEYRQRCEMHWKMTCK